MFRLFLALGFVSLYNGKEQLGRDDVNRPESQGTNWFPGTAVMFATLPTIKYTLRVPLNESIIVVQRH